MAKQNFSLDANFEQGMSVAAGNDVTLYSDGSADQKARVQAAIDALPLGGTLYLRGTFLVSGRIDLKSDMTLKSNGAVIRCTVTLSTSHAVVVADTKARVTIDGITVLGGASLNAGVNVGILAYNCSRVVVKNCTVKYCAVAGIRFNPTCVDCVADRCDIQNVKYSPTGDTGSADGIYIHSGTNTIVSNCVISDFRRIGVVSEGLSTGALTKSTGTVVDSCRIFNGHDADDISGQKNAAIWFENSNGGTVTNCNISDMGNNAGQTHATPAGIVIGPGVAKTSKFVVSGGTTIEMGDNATTSAIGYGILVTGNGNYQNAEISDCIIRNSSVAVFFQGEPGECSLTDVTVDGCAAGYPGDGTITFRPGGGSPTFTQLIMRNVRFKQCAMHPSYTVTTDDAVNFFVSGGLLTRLAIENCDLSMIYQSGQAVGSSISIKGSTLYYGASTHASAYCALNSSKLDISDTTIKFMPGKTDPRLFRMATNANQIDYKFTNCTFYSATIWGDGSGGGASTFAMITFNGCHFYDSHIDLDVHQTGGSFKFTLANCTWTNYPSTGALKTNTYNHTLLSLHVTNCHFRNATDVTPIQKGTNNAGFSHLVGNTYNSTSLHNFSAGATAANNTAGGV